MARKKIAKTDWRALLALYEALLKIAPSAGALVAHSIVIAQLKGNNVGLESLKACEEHAVPHFQPLWAVYASCMQDREIQVRRYAASRKHCYLRQSCLSLIF